MRWIMRRCSVVLRRCDGHGHVPAERRCAASPDAPHHAQNDIDRTLLIIKTEHDAEDPVEMQGPGVQLAHSLQDIDMAVKAKGDFLMKTEDETDDLVVKEEFDIGPTVLQQKTSLCLISPPTQAYANPQPNRSSRAAAAPALSCAVGGTRMGAVNHHFKENSGVPSYDVLGWDVRRTNSVSESVSRERRYERPRYGTAAGCGYGADTSSVKTSRITSGKRYECNYCRYSTTTKYDLVNHIYTHTGEKPYTCDQCEYKSTRMHTLKMHMRRHTGEKPHKCEYCEYHTSRKSDLVRHMLSHIGKKPYKCENCEYRASQKAHLIMHMFTHTGEKRHKCEYCEYHSSRKSDLVRHIGRHHIGK